LDDSMTTACKERLGKESEKEGKSVVFNPRLYKACMGTLKKFTDAKLDDCESTAANHGDFKTVFTDERLYGQSLACLTTNVKAIDNGLCKGQVFKKEQVDNEDINFRTELRRACNEDVLKFCKAVTKGKANVLR